jgi:hypothetical protein
MVGRRITLVAKAGNVEAARCDLWLCDGFTPVTGIVSRGEICDWWGGKVQMEVETDDM